MKEVLRPLKVHMSAGDVMSVLAQMNEGRDGEPGAPAKMGSIDLDVDRESMIAGCYHPIVRTQPVTGEKALYVDETYSSGIEGMTEAEGPPSSIFCNGSLHSRPSPAGYAGRRRRWPCGTTGFASIRRSTTTMATGGKCTGQPCRARRQPEASKFQSKVSSSATGVK